MDKVIEHLSCPCDAWGTNAIETISQQLHRELPGLRGFSAAAIKKMRIFYEQWSILENRSLVVNEITSNSLSIETTALANRSLAVDDLEVKKPHENPSIGIVLCKSANKPFVEFLIQGYDNPMGVATYKTADEIRRLLPSEEDLQKILEE